MALEQDYPLAVSWFKKSKFDMVKHWLGVCHYLGYGVLQNTKKAVEYFLDIGTTNSKTFLKNCKALFSNQKLTGLAPTMVDFLNALQKF